MLTGLLCHYWVNIVICYLHCCSFCQVYLSLCFWYFWYTWLEHWKYIKYKYFNMWMCIFKKSLFKMSNFICLLGWFILIGRGEGGWQNSVDNTFPRWMICARDVRATVCSLYVCVTEQQRIRLEWWLTYLYNKLFKTCILPFNFEHPVI